MFPLEPLIKVVPAKREGTLWGIVLCKRFFDKFTVYKAVDNGQRGLYFLQRVGILLPVMGRGFEVRGYLFVSFVPGSVVGQEHGISRVFILYISYTVD